jgi:hypothetical protein
MIRCTEEVEVKMQRLFASSVAKFASLRDNYQF